MSSLRFDVRMVQPAEAAGRIAIDASRLLEGGDRIAAGRGYRQAAAMPVAHRSSLVNLAAVAIGLGEAQAARTHAMRALQADGADADAWVNLGVASWHAGLHREAAQATDRALRLVPGMEAAASNLSLMFQAVGQPERARATLADALEGNPGSVRLQQSMAEVCRLLGDRQAARRHALAALRLLQGSLAPQPSPGEVVDARDVEAGRDSLHAALSDSCGRLRQAGIDHLLIGGLVLGIAREGEPFAGDKDIDFQLDAGVDRAAVAAAFAEGFAPIRVPAAHAEATRRWCMGYVHEASGIGIDLFLAQRGVATMRQSLGWPDDLFYEYPRFTAGMLAWRGRDWPVPAPLGDYLASNYGDDWHNPRRVVDGGRSFDKRWFDTQISCPGLMPGSQSAAVTLGLLRLLQALQAGPWTKARALCLQLLAREPLAEVDAVLDRLESAGVA